MPYRNDVFGFDPAESEGAVPGDSRMRRHDPDAEPGWGAQGAASSWASSRQEQRIREHGGREHGGFSNYAGGGDRDRFAREREARLGSHVERWHRVGQPRDEGWYGTTGRFETESWYAAPGEAPLRGTYGPRHGGWGEPRARELDLREREWGSTFDRFPSWADGFYGAPRVLDELRRAALESPFADLDRGPYYGKGPKGFKRSDERIREEVCETIARRGWIDASDVEVSVERGVVRLSGTVCRSRDRRVLEALVERVLGVEEVKNELRLARGETSPTFGVQAEHRTQAPSGREPPDDGRIART
jgi:osmotically-inducible protein OsmY